MKALQLLWGRERTSFYWFWINVNVTTLITQFISLFLIQSLVDEHIHTYNNISITIWSMPYRWARSSHGDRLWLDDHHTTWKKRNICCLGKQEKNFLNSKLFSENFTRLKTWFRALNTSIYREVFEKRYFFLVW